VFDINFGREAHVPGQDYEHYPISSLWEAGLSVNLRYPFGYGSRFIVSPVVGLEYRIPYWTSIWPRAGIQIEAGKNFGLYLQVFYSIRLFKNSYIEYGLGIAEGYADQFQVSIKENPVQAITVSIGIKMERIELWYYLDGRRVWR
jgi:hypothetical protein